MEKLNGCIVSTCMRRGFTLIELLVVISIIALLMSVLMPALSTAKEKARIVVCGAQLGQIGTTFHTYAFDYKDELPPSFGSGNWNAFYDFTRDALSRYNVGDGKIFYCPSYRSDIEDPWNTPSPVGNGRNIYYMGYDLFTNVIRADIDPLRYRPWALSNGIDEPLGRPPTLSWHYSVVHADRELRDVIPVKKLSDSSSSAKIYGTVHTVRIRPVAVPMVFDQAVSRDGVFRSQDTRHVRRSQCLGRNAVFLDGHAEWRTGQNMKILREYGNYHGVELARWF